MAAEKRVFSFLCFLFLFTIVLIFTTGPVLAGQFNIPYPGYTYDYWQRPVPSPRPYYPQRVFTGSELGVGSLSEPRDIHISNHDDHIYLTDTGNDRIIRLTPDWKVDLVVDSFKREGQKDYFASPRGIYAGENSDIYIADRENRRIVILDKAGEYVSTISSPDTELAGIDAEDFIFRPTKVVVDSIGRIYVISDEVYDGIMKFGADERFMGFIGAPELSIDLSEYIWRRISPQERRERMRLYLPTDYSNLDLDERDFIYATVSSGEVAEEHAVRRLNPSGQDTLRRQGFYPPVGDYGLALQDPTDEDNLASSTFVDIVTRDNGIYSVLDRTRGRIFTYDEQGFLLYVFGGESRRRGTFRRPSGLAVQEDRLVVVDSLENTITIFNPTSYTQYIHAAIDYYNRGRYQEAIAMWQETLRRNSNYDLAYSGIGRGLLRQDNFAGAALNFQLGQDRRGYSRAFLQYRRQKLLDNFNVLLFAFLAIIVLAIIFFKFNVRKKAGQNIKRVDNKITEKMMGSSEEIMFVEKLALWFYNLFRKILKGLSYSLKVIFHPFSGFWKLKGGKKGNVPAATVLLFLVILSYIFSRQYTGFPFNFRDLNRLNAISEALNVLVPFVLWCLVNWSLTTLMDGKGTFKDIYLMSAYALTPIFLINIPLTVISNYLTLEEAPLYYFVLLLGVFWTLFLLFFGTLTIHHYTLGKTILVTIMIIMGIILCMFMGLLFFNLIEQVISFLTEIYTEIVYRL